MSQKKAVIRTLTPDQIRGLSVGDMPFVPQPPDGKAHVNISRQLYKGAGSIPYNNGGPGTPRFDLKCSDHGVIFYEPNFLNGQTVSKDSESSVIGVKKPYTTKELSLTTSSAITNGDFEVTVVVIYDVVDIETNS